MGMETELEKMVNGEMFRQLENDNVLTLNEGAETNGLTVFSIAELWTENLRGLRTKKLGVPSTVGPCELAFSGTNWKWLIYEDFKVTY